MCIIITPTRGTLDELYCSSYPYEFNKSNILYLLHHHINHPNNESILPGLMKVVSNIIPYGSGQRLLRLISTKFFNKDIYKNWEKIAFGTYGKVYQCSTGLKEPAFVAVKQMNVAESIYDPCHLFDIFTEITALETFRMENCVTQLYDYGLDSEHYYIVLKRYQMSLKEWRNMQTGTFNDNLPVYLSIFREVLKAVKTIHCNNITHYDLKCDNILIDFNLKGNLNTNVNTSSLM
jgi:serine/threonine protein kinase